MVRQYLKMVRPHIVLGGLLAFTLGALLGIVNGGAFDPLHFAVFYAVIFFGDLSTHFSNDYFDYEQDRQDGRKNSRLSVTNPNMLQPARNISLVLLTVSVAVAALAVALRLAPVELLLVGLAVNFLGWFYSAPPLRLVSRGLGEATIALAVGLGIPAAGYLSAVGQFDGWFVLFLFPFLMYGFMLALCLEAPDVWGDRLGGKKTLGALKGVEAVYAAVWGVALAALVWFIGVAYFSGASAADFWVVTAFASVPFAAGTAGLLGVRNGKKTLTLSLAGVFSLFIFNVLMVGYLLLLISGVL